MADVEACTVQLLDQLFPTLFVCTEVPPDPQFTAAINAGGIVQVERIAGPSGRNGNPAAGTVDVDCYASTRISARALCYQVESALLAFPNHVVAGGTVTLVSITGPALRPYDDNNVRRFGASFTVYAH